MCNNVSVLEMLERCVSYNQVSFYVHISSVLHVSGLVTVCIHISSGPPSWPPPSPGQETVHISYESAQLLLASTPRPQTRMQAHKPVVQSHAPSATHVLCGEMLELCPLVQSVFPESAYGAGGLVYPRIILVHPYPSPP